MNISINSLSQPTPLFWFNGDTGRSAAAAALQSANDPFEFLQSANDGSARVDSANE